MPEKILSICIPTYNRADILDKTLSTLVSEPSFIAEKIEICISDNASTDNTGEVVKQYTDKYSNIIYNRNIKNTEIIDGNFPIVGEMASGTFIKFLNDYASFKPGELDKIIEFIETNRKERPVLFFSNNNLRNKTTEVIHCDTLDQFVQEASYFITWVLAAGMWRDDFRSINDRDRSVVKFMWCPDNYLRLISAGRKAIIYNRQFCVLQTLKSKGGYNIFQVFVINYLGLYDEYRAKKQISGVTMFNEKTKLFLYFLIPWTLNLQITNSFYSFSKQGAFKLLFKKYWSHPILYIGVVYLFFRTLLKKIKHL